MRVDLALHVDGDVEPLLRVEGLTTDFPGRRALDGVSFSISRGKVVALVGASGSGKTVTALSVLRLIRKPGRVSAGRVLHHGRDLLRLPEADLRAIRGGRIATVFQDPLTSLHPAMRIGDQIGEAVRAHLSLDGPAVDRRIEEVLHLSGMPQPAARARAFPHELSSGLRQRATVAMALAAGPELLIADEPTTALDSTLQAEILALFARLRRELGLSILLITHDLAIVSEIADEVLVMDHGRIVERGAPRDLFHQPAHPSTAGLVSAIRALETPGPRAIAVQPRLLQLRSISKRFGPGALAVDDVSLDIAAGETLALVGESGSGKTTLGRLAVRLLQPNSGSVLFEGTELGAVSAGALRRVRRDLQIIFADAAAALDPRQRVEAAVAEPLDVHGLIRSRDERRIRVGELLLQVGLDASLSTRYPHQLSGGQRQRVTIARALATRPKLIVADEPLSAVDVIVQAQIVELLEELRHTSGLAFLIIAHDLRVVRRLAMRVAVMHGGRLVEVSPADDLYRSPLHPYTAALISAMPGTEPGVRISLPQAGVDSGAGCAFRPRCAVLDKPAICTSLRPELREVAPGRFVACHVAG